MSKEVKKVSEEDLNNLRELNKKFSDLHKQVGDFEVKKHQALLAIESLKQNFKDLESSMIKNYGDNIVVNLETGEIKDKPKDGENK